MKTNAILAGVLTVSVIASFLFVKTSFVTTTHAEEATIPPPTRFELETVDVFRGANSSMVYSIEIIKEKTTDKRWMIVRSLEGHGGLSVTEYVPPPAVQPEKAK